MLALLGDAVYLSGGLVFCGFLLLPALFLLLVSVVYFVFDAIQNFRERHGWL